MSLGPSPGARSASGAAPYSHTETCDVSEDRVPRAPYERATETGGSDITGPALEGTDLEA